MLSNRSILILMVMEYGFLATIWSLLCVMLGIGVSSLAPILLLLYYPEWWPVWLLLPWVGWKIFEQNDNWWWQRWIGPGPGLVSQSIDELFSYVEGDMTAFEAFDDPFYTDVLYAPRHLRKVDVFGNPLP